MRDDAQLASGSFDNTIRIWCLLTDTCLHTLSEHTSWIRSLLYVPREKSSHFLVSGSRDTTVRVWTLRGDDDDDDNDTWQCVHTLSGHTDGIRNVIHVRTRNQLVSCSWDHTVRVWCMRTGECMQILDEHAASVKCVLVFPLGAETYLVSGSNDHTLKVWEMTSGRCVRTLRGHSSIIKNVDVVFAAAASTSMKSWELVSSSNDYTVKIWSLSLGQCLRTLVGHERGISCMLFVPSTGQLVTGSSDNTVKVWEMSTGVCTRTLIGHTDAVKCLAFARI